ncbi:MAG: hypothetical protein NTX35_17570 [Verrucomicrobia bacterium]|nr:hypothetical protein [Verrucomicrobiota bacterium]
MLRLKTSFFLAAVQMLTVSAFAGEAIEQDSKFMEVAQRFQTDFGLSLKRASIDDPVFAKNYNVTALKPEHHDNALQILTWVETELKRYPAEFIQKHGPKNLVLANAYISKSAKGAALTYSPTFVSDRASDSILVTVPTTMTPAVEVLGRGYIHRTLFNDLLADVTSPGSPLALPQWKTLESDESKLENESAKRLTKASNAQEGLYQVLWDAWEFNELLTLAKTDAKLKQRIDIVKALMTSLDPQFNEAFWSELATIPDHQRTICLNDLTDTHSVDKIKADAEIQSDIRKLEKQWGFKVLWEPGSEAPPMPVKVRLEYSYFTDKKLTEFKAFMRMCREQLEIYPEQITKQLNVKNLYMLDTFNFRGAGVAGQGMSWLPQASFAYGLRTFDPAVVKSMDFLRRTIHHEVLHLMDREFSKEGGPIYGRNWDSLNQEGFHYKVGSPGAASSASQLRFYKDNTKVQGFAEPYGMNIATDDRATLYARLMTAHVADEGRGDQPFLEKLKTDPILKAKADRLIEFFQVLKRDLVISETSLLYSQLEGACPPQKDK